MADFSNIIQEINTNLPDNNTQSITAAKLRTTLIDFVNEVDSNEDNLETAIGGKQNILTFDSTPTENSTNPVTSGGVYDALQNVTDTFESGQNVGEVSIVNDLTTGGENNVLSAEQGKELNEDISQLDQDISQLDQNISQLDQELNMQNISSPLSFVNRVGGYITVNGTIQSSGTYCVWYFPCIIGDVFKFSYESFTSGSARSYAIYSTDDITQAGSTNLISLGPVGSAGVQYSVTIANSEAKLFCITARADGTYGESGTIERLGSVRISDIENDISELTNEFNESSFPFIGKTIDGFRINLSTLTWEAGNYSYKIITLPKDKNTILIKNTNSSVQAFFLESVPTPVAGESVTSIIGAGLIKDFLIDIPNEANYLYCYWRGNPIPTEIIVNGVDILNDYPNNIESVAYNAQVENDNNNFLPYLSYRGYINAGVWTDINKGNRSYKIIEIPEVIVGKTLTLVGNNIGAGVLNFLSEYSTPTEGESASVVGSQVTIAINATVNVEIPEGTKYIYMLSYSGGTNLREPVSMTVAGIELRDNLKNSVLTLASRNTPISPGSITEDLLSPEVTNKLVYDVPSYMQEEFVMTKDTLDKLVDSNSCSIGLVTDLHITPYPSSSNFKAVKESVQTLGLLSKQFPLSFSIALGDYVANFTPDSKEGGIRCIEYVNEWMSSIWGRSNMLVGNHESQWSSQSSYGLTLSEFLGLSYNKYAQKFGYNIDYSGTNITISHSDDAISKIRHIFLNSFAVSYIDSTAIAQTVSVVSSAPADYGIVVYSHFGVDVWSSGGYENPIAFSQVRNAIDAIKTEISGSTKELICWIGGHTHVDHIVIYNDTPVVSLLRTCLGTQQGQSQDGITYTNKVVGTPTMETSTILTIRRDTGKLYFTRIGCGVDMEVNYNSTGGQTIGRVWNTLTGVVYGSDGSTPISGVTVSMKFIGATYTTTTNASGEYSFDKLPKETGTLTASLTGYVFEDITLTISGNMTQDIVAEN